jgi:hypothetical protein
MAACALQPTPMAGTSAVPDWGWELNPNVNFNPEAPAFTPLSETRMRADAAEFIPMLGGLATVQRAAEAYQHQPKQKRQMPPATDEEWKTRIAKREKEVSTIKSLQSYRLYAEVFPHGERGDHDPKTPDPHDRKVSKRMWKWNVEKWRLQLKSQYVYSRAVTLQCREYLRKHDNSAETSAGSANTDATIFVLGRMWAEPADRLPQQFASAASTAANTAAAIPEPPGFTSSPSAPAASVATGSNGSRFQ